MRVALTEDQIRKVWILAQRTEVASEFRAYLNAELIPCSGNRRPRWSIFMPPDAWLWVRDLLVAHCYHENGRPRRGIERESSWNSLCRHVVTAVNRRQAHPALTGRAMAGGHIEEIACWTHPSGWIPFLSWAEEGAELRVLVPVTTHKLGLTLTQWGPGRPTYDLALMEEATHRVFCRQVEVLTRDPD